MAFAPASRPLAARFYATEPESKAEGEAAAEGNGKQNGTEAEAEDPLKKEVEAKNKEILELKVCGDTITQHSQANNPRIAICAR